MPHHFTCLDCKYFLRHYTKRENGSFVPAAHGHCRRPRIKLRQIESPACDKFLPRPGRT